MSPRTHAIATGAKRGWHEALLSLRSTQDQSFYFFMAAGVLTYLWFSRNETIEGTDIPLVTAFMPSMIGALVVFSGVVGATFALAMEREDGTLLRSKAVPHGMTGYVVGQLTLQTLSFVPLLTVILIPGTLLLGVTAEGTGGWLRFAWILVLGIVAVLPIGIIIGSLVPSVQKASTWGLLPVILLAFISGVFFPVDGLWAWVQWVAQAFPMYWLALGMRSAFLPEALAALELTGSWRTGSMIAVLAAWAVVGSSIAVVVLRRMARRQSGSQVEAARQAATQWVR